MNQFRIPTLSCLVCHSLTRLQILTSALTFVFLGIASFTASAQTSASANIPGVSAGTSVGGGGGGGGDSSTSGASGSLGGATTKTASGANSPTLISTKQLGGSLTTVGTTIAASVATPAGSARSSGAVLILTSDLGGASPLASTAATLGSVSSLVASVLGLKALSAPVGNADSFTTGTAF